MNKIKEPPQRELEILFQYFQNQDDHRGKELARSIIEEFPNHQLTWKILAAILTRTGRDSEGITAYQKAIELDPQDHEAYNNLGKAFQDSQRFKESEKNLRQALALKSDFGIALYNLANTLNLCNKFEESIIYYKKALDFMPNVYAIHNNIGVVLHALRKYEEAETFYRQALKIKPDSFEALSNLSATLNSLQRYGEAIDACIESLEINPDYEFAYRNMANFLMGFEFNSHRPDIAKIILKILNKKDIINPGWLSSAVISLLKLDPLIINNLNKLSSGKLQDMFEEILVSLSNIPLLLRLMESSNINDLELEDFFKKLRSVILINISKIENNSEILNFQVSLSSHCYMNEYLYDETSEEIEALKKLEDLVKSKISNGYQPSSNELAALASYKALNKYSWIHSIEIPIELEFLKTRQILEPIEEENLKTEISILENVLNSTSIKVRQQYEENPYPRWTETGMIKKRGSIESLIKLLNLKLINPSISEVIAPEILIAGCGTGQQVFGTIGRFNNCKILAVDLSLSSLAYAKRKTKEYGVSNVQYMQADILDLGMLDRKFDLIECTGVLHHMEDPMKGWKTLADLLRSGGIMKIALYSKLARKHIFEIRNEIIKLNIKLDHNSLKAFRNYAINSKESRYKKLTQSRDFFSISTFRDLVFHVQEHQFTFTEIKTSLDKLGLVFCGLDDVDIEKIKNNFKIHNKLESDIYDLEKWNTFEEKNQSAFVGMYQFWCQKL